MNLATASARFIKHLKVRTGTTGQVGGQLYGEVISVRIDPADRAGSLVTVRLNSGRVEEYDADQITPTETAFRCDFCHKPRPQHTHRKVFGVSIPRSCDDCLPAAKRFLLMQAASRGLKK
jgi:hypothetical protein